MCRGAACLDRGESRNQVMRWFALGLKLVVEEESMAYETRHAAWQNSKGFAVRLLHEQDPPEELGGGFTDYLDAFDFAYEWLSLDDVAHEGTPDLGIFEICDGTEARVWAYPPIMVGGGSELVGLFGFNPVTWKSPVRAFQPGERRVPVPRRGRSEPTVEHRSAGTTPQPAPIEGDAAAFRVAVRPAGQTVERRGAAPPEPDQAEGHAAAAEVALRPFEPTVAHHAVAAAPQPTGVVDRRATAARVALRPPGQTVEDSAAAPSAPDQVEGQDEDARVAERAQRVSIASTARAAWDDPVSRCIAILGAVSLWLAVVLADPSFLLLVLAAVPGLWWRRSRCAAGAGDLDDWL